MAKNTKKDALKGMLAASGQGGPGMQSMPTPAPQTSFRNPLMPATSVPATPAPGSVPAQTSGMTPALHVGNPNGDMYLPSPGTSVNGQQQMGGGMNFNASVGGLPGGQTPSVGPNPSLMGGKISLPGGGPAPTQPLQKKNVIKSLMKIQSPQDRYKGLASPDARSAGPSPKPAQLYPGTQAPSEQQLKDFQGGRPMQF